jgi:hypothetical protein
VVEQLGRVHILQIVNGCIQSRRDPRADGFVKELETVAPDLQ